MAKHWDDIGDGKFKLTVSPDNGGPASIYYGTKEEILDKLAESQANANAALNGFKVPTANGNSPSPNSPKSMTPSERMQTVSDLANPARVEEGVKRVLETVIGPMDSFQREREQAERERLGQAQEAAAFEFFTKMGTAWNPSEHNKQTMVRYMLTQGLDLAKTEDYERAFADLEGAKLLQQTTADVQDDDEVEVGLHRRNAENPAPKTPSRYSTGVRSSDVSGTAPMPVRRLKYSRDQIRNISAATYKTLMMTDPEFSRCVEFYERPKAQTTSTRRSVAV